MTSIFDEFKKQYGILVKETCICNYMIPGVVKEIGYSQTLVPSKIDFKHIQKIVNMLEPICKCYNYELKKILLFIKQNFKCKHMKKMNKLILHIIFCLLFNCNIKYELSDIEHKKFARYLLNGHDSHIQDYDNLKSIFRRIYYRSSYMSVHNFLKINSINDNYKEYFKLCDKKGITESYEANKYQILVDVLHITDDKAKLLLQSKSLSDILIENKIELNVLESHVLSSVDFNKYIKCIHPKKSLVRIMDKQLKTYHYKDNIYISNTNFFPTDDMNYGGIYFELVDDSYDPEYKIGHVNIIEDDFNYVYIQDTNTEKILLKTYTFFITEN